MKQFINKKNRKRLIAGAAALTMLTAAFAGTLSVSAQEDTMVRSFLTGKPVPESIGRKKAISVMLNNIQDALPQSGIANAEVKSLARSGNTVGSGHFLIKAAIMKANFPGC